MRNAGLEEAQAGIKIAARNINNLRYADDTTLMAESDPFSGDIPDPGIEPGSHALQADSLPSELPGTLCRCWGVTIALLLPAP